MIRLISIYFFLTSSCVLGQKAIIEGVVSNKVNNDKIYFATIYIEGSSIATNSDENGYYKLENLEPGFYNVTATYIGFKKKTIYEIEVRNNKVTQLDFSLSEDQVMIDQVEIKAKAFIVNEESPISLRSINASEIARNPGGNRDISKVLQSLPGVASSNSFRNDIIIRGGAPNENRFYLEGIEVPNINHFATQGSSGGPVGMIDANLIRSVDFYSGAFPVNKGNALSSIVNFNLKKGNTKEQVIGATLGSSDAGFKLEGPIGKKSSFILSLRRSYLQFLFKAIGLPFLPTYNDLLYKQNLKINDKNSITFIALGALDKFELNSNANQSITDQATIERNNYILGYLPINNQWNYTVGGKWTHFGGKHYQNVYLSRNHLNNTAFKYVNNTESLGKSFDYKSEEIETKFRYELNTKWNNWKIQYGLGLQNVLYTNQTQSQMLIGNNIIPFSLNSRLTFYKYALFTSFTKQILNNRLSLSFGIRVDANTYSKEMQQYLQQLSPRISTSYKINEKWRWNSNVGQYQQLPAYTILGYKEKDVLINKNNGVRYIQVQHLVSGLEFLPNAFTKLSIEGFYKNYQYYPFSLTDSISLANLGADFGVIGNEAVASSSNGRTYGLELLIQKKLNKIFYGIISYTLVRSEFVNKNGELKPSAWDNGQILNLTGGVRLKRNWEIGVKFRYSGGTPYTPYKVSTSSIKQVWDTYKKPIFNFDQLNTARFDSYHSADLRIDKKWYGEKVLFNLYLDVQNLYNAQFRGIGYYDTVKDNNNIPITDPNNQNKYLLKYIEDISGNRLPSIGILIEF